MTITSEEEALRVMQNPENYLPFLRNKATSDANEYLGMGSSLINEFNRDRFKAETAIIAQKGYELAQYFLPNNKLTSIATFRAYETLLHVLPESDYGRRYALSLELVDAMMKYFPGSVDMHYGVEAGRTAPMLMRHYRRQAADGYAKDSKFEEAINLGASEFSDLKNDLAWIDGQSWPEPYKDGIKSDVRAEMKTCLKSLAERCEKAGKANDAASWMGQEAEVLFSLGENMAGLKRLCDASKLLENNGKIAEAVQAGERALLLAAEKLASEKYPPSMHTIRLETMLRLVPMCLEIGEIGKAEATFAQAKELYGKWQLKFKPEGNRLFMETPDAQMSAADGLKVLYKKAADAIESRGQAQGDVPVKDAPTAPGKSEAAITGTSLKDVQDAYGIYKRVALDYRLQRIAGINEKRTKVGKPPLKMQ